MSNILIDTHAHIYVAQLMPHLDDLVSRMEAENVQEVYMPNINLDSIGPMLETADRFPFCKPMMGLHPCDVGEHFSRDLDAMEQLLADGVFYGIGETGIDLYWDKTFIEEQKKSFAVQISWAKSTQLPIIIHSRDSLELTISMIESAQDGNLTGVFHCFTGTQEEAKRIEDAGFYMGIGGVVTYKNSGLDRIVPHINPDRIVLETDSPYLSPVPYRGKPNEPAYLKVICEKVADCLNKTADETARLTTINARNLFSGTPKADAL